MRVQKVALALLYFGRVTLKSIDEVTIKIEGEEEIEQEKKVTKAAKSESKSKPKKSKKQQ